MRLVFLCREDSRSGHGDSPSQRLAFSVKALRVLCGQTYAHLRLNCFSVEYRMKCRWLLFGDTNVSVGPVLRYDQHPTAFYNWHFLFLLTIKGGSCLPPFTQVLRFFIGQVLPTNPSQFLRFFMSQAHSTNASKESLTFLFHYMSSCPKNQALFSPSAPTPLLPFPGRHKNKHKNNTVNDTMGSYHLRYLFWCR